MDEKFLNSRELQVLVDAAFAGCSRGLVANARKIFDTICEIYPDYVAASVGKAFSHIVVDDFSVAEEILGRLLEKDSSNDDARGFLALSKFLQKDQNALDEIMQQFADTSSNGYRLAQNLVSAG